MTGQYLLRQLITEKLGSWMSTHTLKWITDAKSKLGLKSRYILPSEPSNYSEGILKVLQKMDFSTSLKPRNLFKSSSNIFIIFFHYKNNGYNITVLQQTACLMINHITVGNFFSSLIARRRIGIQTP